MAEVLIATLSPIGHIGPLLNVAQGLADRGDQVTVLSRAGQRRDDPRSGSRTHPIPAAADFDDTRLDADNPGRAETSGIKRVNFDIVRLFVAPMPHQTTALAELMAQKHADAVIVDYGFFGIMPFLLGDRRPTPSAPLQHHTVDARQPRHRTTGLGLPPSSTRPGKGSQPGAERDV